MKTVISIVLFLILFVFGSYFLIGCNDIISNDRIEFCSRACFVRGTRIDKIVAFPYTCVCRNGEVFDFRAMEKYFKGVPPK